MNLLGAGRSRGQLVSGSKKGLGAGRNIGDLLLRTLSKEE
jgi:hypothetical protein